MTDKLSAMDVYSSRMDIPFDVAAYCRGHKFSPEAVHLAQAINRAAHAKTLLGHAEELLDLREREVKEALDGMRAKMEKTDGV